MTVLSLLVQLLGARRLGLRANVKSYGAVFAQIVDGFGVVCVKRLSHAGTMIRLLREKHIFCGNCIALYIGLRVWSLVYLATMRTMSFCVYSRPNPLMRFCLSHGTAPSSHGSRHVLSSVTELRSMESVDCTFHNEFT